MEFLELSLIICMPPLLSQEILSTFLRADGCSKRASEFFRSGCHLKPSDGRRLNFLIIEHRSMFDRLNGVVRQLKEHDSTLFETNWLILKQFAHDFNVKQIKFVEAKLLKVKQDMEMLGENKKCFHTLNKGIHKKHISKRRRKNENRRKSEERKKRDANNVERVYGICVSNPLGNDLAERLVYPPSQAIPEECINVEDVAELLNRRDARYIAQMLQANHFSNAAGSRIITILKLDVKDDVYCFLYPEKYALPEQNDTDCHSASITSDEEELEED